MPGNLPSQTLERFPTIPSQALRLIRTYRPANLQCYCNTSSPSILELPAAKGHLLRSLSLSYHKKDWQAGPHHSFFWYETDYRFVICTLYRLCRVVVSCQNKDWQGPIRQSFFWYDNGKDLKRHVFAAQASLTPFNPIHSVPDHYHPTGASWLIV